VVKSECIFRIINKGFIKCLKSFFIPFKFLESNTTVKVSLRITCVIFKIAVKRIDCFIEFTKFEVGKSQVIIGFRVRRFDLKCMVKSINCFLIPANLC